MTAAVKSSPPARTDHEIASAGHPVCGKHSCIGDTHQSERRHSAGTSRLCDPHSWMDPPPCGAASSSKPRSGRAEPPNPAQCSPARNRRRHSWASGARAWARDGQPYPKAFRPQAAPETLRPGHPILALAGHMRKPSPDCASHPDVLCDRINPLSCGSAGDDGVHLIDPERANGIQ